MYPTSLTLLMAFSLGCGGSDSQDVSIGFAVKIGADALECGETYDNLGTNNTSLAISDVRFFVHNVELRNSEGVYVPLSLQSNDFQTDSVALLDFEDCGAMGNPEINASVKGSIEPDTYDAIRFKMGVPFALNHANPAAAESPLNVGTMNWNWKGGYKFLRIDSGTFAATDWRLHLGSGGCDGDPIAGGTTNCTHPNVVDVDLSAFDPTSNTVVADIAALVASSPLDENQAETKFGCQSALDDTDCEPLFESLGLDFGTTTRGTQSFFSVE